MRSLQGSFQRRTFDDSKIFELPGPSYRMVRVIRLPIEVPAEDWEDLG